MKDFAGRINSFEESGKNYLQRDRENQVRRELRIFQFFVLGFHLISRSFRNLLNRCLTLMLRILKHYQRSVSKDPVIKDRKLKEEYPNPATVLT